MLPIGVSLLIHPGRSESYFMFIMDEIALAIHILRDNRCPMDQILADAVETHLYS